MLPLHIYVVHRLVQVRHGGREVPSASGNLVSFAVYVAIGVAQVNGGREKVRRAAWEIVVAWCEVAAAAALIRYSPVYVSDVASKVARPARKVGHAAWEVPADGVQVVRAAV